MVTAEAQRTLVKSPPELWSELSDPAALARHLGELGEIRIVRTDPEQSVEWEAQDTRGRVEITPAGWGTKVTLSVTIDEASPAPDEPPPRPGGPPAAARAELLPRDPDRQSQRPPAKASQTEPSAAIAPIRAAPEPALPEPAIDPPLAPFEPKLARADQPPEPQPSESRAPQRRSGLKRLLMRIREAFGAKDRDRERERPREPAVTLRAATPAGARGRAPRDEPRPATQPTAATEPRAASPQMQMPEMRAPEMAAPAETAVPPTASDLPAAVVAEEAPQAGAPADREGDQDEDESGGEQAEQTTALLSAVLDRLGEAHHRPFSRA